MKMKKILQTLRYLSKSVTGMTVIGFLCILATVAISDLVYFLTDYFYNTVHPVVTLMAPFEVTAGIFALLIGLVLFITTFKVALANGISRKSFLLANIPAAGIPAAAFSIFNLIVVKIHGLFWPINTIIEWNYPQIGWAGLLILQFTLYLLLITAGWFITLAYYRSSVPVKWAISLAPFIFYGLLQIANARTGGTIFQAIMHYQFESMRMDRTPFTLLVYAAILCGLVYLLLRRAPLKD
jgi:hypothetical protein